MNITELSSIMKDAGVVGAGGAGFPSYAKLNEKADTIILNCAECEPLLKLHRLNYAQQKLQWKLQLRLFSYMVVMVISENMTLKE